MSLDTENRRQTYWDTEMTSYRRRRRGSFTWPIILAILMIVSMALVLWRLYGVPWMQELAEEAEVILIEPTQDIIKNLPDDPGGIAIPHQDKFIYNAIDGSKPLTGLGADFQATMIRQEPEPPMNVRDVLEKEVQQNVKSVTRRAEGLLKNVVTQGVKRLRNSSSDEDLSTFPSPLEVAEADVAVVEEKAGTIVTKGLEEGVAQGIENVAGIVAGVAETAVVQGVNQEAAVQKGVAQEAAGDMARVSAAAAALEKSLQTSPPIPVSQASVLVDIDVEEVIEQNKKVPSPPQPVYVVQTSAMYTAQAAEKEWLLQLREQPKLLGPMPHKVCEHAVKGFGQLHRLYVGNFSTYDQAKEFCEQLKIHDIDCFARELPLNYANCEPKAS